MMRSVARICATGSILAGVLALQGCGGRTDLGGGALTDGGGADTGLDVDAGPPKLATSNKLDLLFAIDNSSSMGDKQQLLLQAIPTFMSRLSNPWCVPQSDPLGVAVPSQNGQCASGYKLEFSPIQDIHVGIVTSSLGGGGSPDLCVPVNAQDPTHQNDKGHLINRTRPTSPGGPEGAVAAAAPIDGLGGNFLAWAPGATEKPNVTLEPSETQLVTDFSSLVGGVQEHGCGLEAQLESWYHFLVQPEPYDAIVLSSSSPPQASLENVDTAVLKQRHDFLRPDSLVVIVQITDEEDSWSDPSWLGGYGWTVRTNNFPGGPGQGVGPRGTTECEQAVDPNNAQTTGPNNPDCVSCAFSGSSKPISGSPIGSDPNCTSCVGGGSCPQKGWYRSTEDGINVRYTSDMRRRYGLDPQWNVQRYVDGLSSRTVPDRDHEVHDATQYANTQKNCQNPLFAASLPDGSDTSASTLCNLPDGPRGTQLVYYLIIGGVPWQLLAQDPLNTSLPLKRTLDSSDWRALIGKDPGTYQYDGIDPHMIESITPRPSLPPPTASDTADPESGREWNTLHSNAGIDLQFACVFDLLQPKDCLDPANASACDCTGAATAADGPPLCDPNNRNVQIRGKAYPTIRELRVAEGVKNQGVVASICPRGDPSSYFEVLFTRVASSVKP